MFTLEVFAYYYWYVIALILAVPSALFHIADRLKRSKR
jgi:hypothetical protein